MAALWTIVMLIILTSSVLGSEVPDGEIKKKSAGHMTNDIDLERRQIDSIGSGFIKRPIDSIGSSFIKKNIDSIGSGFIKRPIDSIGSGFIKRQMDSIGNGFIKRPIDSIGSSFIKKNIDSIGSGFIKRPIDSIGSGFIKRPIDSIGSSFIKKNIDSIGSGFIKRPIDSIGSGFIKKSIDSIGSGFIKRPIDSIGSSFIKRHGNYYDYDSENETSRPFQAVNFDDTEHELRKKRSAQFRLLDRIPLNQIINSLYQHQTTAGDVTYDDVVRLMDLLDARQEEENMLESGQGQDDVMPGYPMESYPGEPYEPVRS